MPNLNPLYYETWFVCGGNDPAAFAIITAHNPNGQKVDAEENEQLNQRLVTRLEELAIGYFPVAAGSKDRSHVEASYGIITDLSTAISLCNQFDQDAIFWIEEGQLSIVDRHETTKNYVAGWNSRLI